MTKIKFKKPNLPVKGEIKLTAALMRFLPKDITYPFNEGNTKVVESLYQAFSNCYFLPKECFYAFISIITTQTVKDYNHFHRFTGTFVSKLVGKRWRLSLIGAYVFADIEKYTSESISYKTLTLPISSIKENYLKYFVDTHIPTYYARFPHKVETSTPVLLANGNLQDKDITVAQFITNMYFALQDLHMVKVGDMYLIEDED